MKKMGPKAKAEAREDKKERGSMSAKAFNKMDVKEDKADAKKAKKK